MSNPILIVGAGLSGLVAARELTRAGQTVMVLDKGRSVGGRLATRRLGAATVDHGAQFFTVRSDRFAAFVDPLVASGAIGEWCRGFNEVDGFPRFFAPGGMNALAKLLAADLPAGSIQTGVTVQAVSRTDEGWRVSWDGGAVDGSAVLLTAPVPQSLALLDSGGTVLDAGLRAGLDAVTYHRVLAALAVLDRPSAIPAPGARQLDEGTFSFVADNQAKSISAVPAITLHANHGWSGEHWDDDPAVSLAALLADATPWLGDAVVAEAELKKWRYSGPVKPWPDATCVAVPGDAPLLLAGDAFAGPKVEGAFLSGLAAGDALHNLR